MSGLFGPMGNLFVLPSYIYQLMPDAVQIFVVGTFGIIALICILKMLF